MEENQKTTISLNLSQRFLLINLIGSMVSHRKTLLPLMTLIEKLSLTQEEALNPNLELKIVEATGAFTWKDNILADLVVDVDFTIINLIINSLKLNNTKEHGDLYDYLNTKIN